MTRYFFHIQTAVLATDLDGVEFPDLDSARAMAARSFGELIKDYSSEFWSTKPWSMTVTDDAGLTLFVLEMHGRPLSTSPD